ncbi:hypothetical protein BDZ94DRAFT_1260364 [Collybia nuda]|uniref:Uncharacterized protein n=1 Tax=Collybia nuda TaxID=64659 RepID=A0A9P5Y3T8_9AGAR|nr:hypothetical protein BDZ94DRAFT_1260364 [Collybia nuda]
MAPSQLTLPLRPYHTSQAAPTSVPFILSVSPDTDLWLKPAPLNGPPGSLPLISKSQPTFYTPIRLATFNRASVTVSFFAEQLYDQAGAILLYPGDTSKWIKAGLEYVDEQAKRSVVVASGGDHGADWSVSPPLASAKDTDPTKGIVRSTVEFEREEGGRGTSLMIKIGGEVVREVTWVFAKGKEDAGEEEIWVGIYGARPAKGDIGDLKVQVEAWELDVDAGK